MSEILFLYATNNSGHQKAAEAIQKSLHLIDPSVVTAEVDFFTRNYPTIGPVIFKMYIELMKSIPRTYDYLYDNRNLAALTTELRQFFSYINLPKLQQVIRENRPKALVCTQAIPAGFVATEKDRGKISLPLFVTITDFVVNPYWPDRQVDGYFVPDEEIREHLVQRGVPRERIKVTGIPIDGFFAQTMAKQEARRRLELKPLLPTVLIMGGSQGLGDIDQTVSLLAENRALQLIIIAGNNRVMLRKLRCRFGGQKHVLVFGYVRNVARLMDAADILVSKPGGITSAEALVKGLPMIIISPLPGQEVRNAEFLTRHGAAERCIDLRTLPRLVESFVGHPQKLRKYQIQALRLGRPYASHEIAHHLLRRIS